MMTNNFLFCKCIYILSIESDDGVSGESDLGVVDVVVFAWAGERRKNKRSTSDCHVRRDIQLHRTGIRIYLILGQSHNIINNIIISHVGAEREVSWWWSFFFSWSEITMSPTLFMIGTSIDKKQCSRWGGGPTHHPLGNRAVLCCQRQSSAE